MNKESILYKKLEKNNVQCKTCCHNCIINPNNFGICNVRQNVNGKLYVKHYDKFSCISIDPIEKKPLFHFYPGNQILSIGSFGCNFKCQFCQNYDISQNFSSFSILKKISPNMLIDIAKSKNINMIAYTYNEPTVFFEYVLETSKLAKKERIKNVWVSNGYFSDSAFMKIKNYIDAINIDFKSMNSKFYQKYVGGNLDNVLLNIEKCFSNNIHLEITYLLIEGLNNNEYDINKLTKFIKNISEKIPLHISKFHPSYKMMNIPPTNFQSLYNAYKIAKKNGLLYVYIGNINNDYENTFCPNCNKLIIQRNEFSIKKHFIEKAQCANCKSKIDIIL